MAKLPISFALVGALVAASPALAVSGGSDAPLARLRESSGWAGAAPSSLLAVPEPSQLISDKKSSGKKKNKKKDDNSKNKKDSKKQKDKKGKKHKKEKEREHKKKPPIVSQ